MNIPIARTQLTEDEINSVLEPIKSGWLVQGKHVKDFEDKWSKFTGAAESIAVTSCTSAMHLSLEALDLQEDFEVIVPAFTWISTANVVEHVGGKVVFCDIDLKTFNIDYSKIEEKITSKTKAIIPVHLFGAPLNMHIIQNIAKEYNLYVIEDAACGFGSKFKDKHVGTFGDTGCFSFHPRKAITTGEGGMITTNNKKLAAKIRCLRDHGAQISDMQRHLGPKPYLLSDHTEAGFNQRMTDIQGVLGSKQMDRANQIIKERRKIAKIYDTSFSNLNWLNTPFCDENYYHSYQSYPCLFKPKEIHNIDEINSLRNQWMDKLQQNGISTRPATHAVHMLKYYKEKYDIKPEEYPNAYFANQCSISFPLFHGLKDNEIEYIISNIQKGFD